MPRHEYLIRSESFDFAGLHGTETTEKRERERENTRLLKPIPAEYNYSLAEPEKDKWILPGIDLATDV